MLSGNGSIRYFFLAPIVFAMVLLAAANAFIQDDAFISLRYASNLALGHGLVWNPGEVPPVEGYTNFLWVMLLSLVELQGLDPVPWSIGLGLFCGAGTLWITFLLALRVTGSSAASWLAVYLLGINYTFSCYMTGGLETSLQTLLVTLAVFWSLRCIDAGLPRKDLQLLSLLLGLLVMVRMDSAIFGSILVLHVFAEAWRQQKGLVGAAARTLHLAYPGLLLLLPWLYFKQTFYGDILPNTYYIKAQGNDASMLLNGVSYAAGFYTNYLFIFFLPFWLIFRRQIFSNRMLRLLLVTSLLWTLYVIKVGGDFMEFRFFVPVLPLLAILVGHSIGLLERRSLRLLLVTMLVCASLYHARFYAGSPTVEPIYSLQGRLLREDSDWIGVGKALRAYFGGWQDPVTIATSAAGAIPYYSKLRTIDMLGLNDRWVARHGVHMAYAPGHTRYVTLSYLLSQDVNLVLGHPRVVSNSQPPVRNAAAFFWAPLDLRLLPATSKVIEVPVNATHKVQILYLTPNSQVDQQISRHHLTTYPLR